MKSAKIGHIKPLDYAGTEALNTICSNLSFAGRNVKKIIMTSCDAGEGKSSMSFWVAQNLAKRGKRIVIVDADLRRSFLVKRYGIETEGEWTGLAHYLVGYSDLNNVVYQTNVQNLYFLPIGRHIANPIPLLNAPEFPQMLDTLAEHFDLVLVDAPPVGLVIDAAEIAQHCDGCIFVVEYQKTRRRELLAARNQIQQTGCAILGCVLNKVTFDTISSKKYYHQNYYSQYTDQSYSKAEND